MVFPSALTITAPETASQTHMQIPSGNATTKSQPWRAVWPAPREPESQSNRFGFKKGEVMIFDGNAGNFFARDKWEVRVSYLPASFAHLTPLSPQQVEQESPSRAQNP